ncbi:TetR family transcriptional regulator [Streptomyces spiralis]|uniref:TetR family transcriptional regulator n=1 Tax=Streptomyces spiralis TaxID=66376 RepID=A0A919DMJ7_9ACTN|nr:TetR family transcriptional regulator [Streptomyces spiralis]
MEECVNSEDTVPDGLRRLWRLSEPSRLGRPAALDIGRVVGVAVELADRDGLGGVTLPKVGAALGVTSMSLYRYVGSKDELLVLMSDAALGDPPALDGGAPSWRDGLRDWARAQREVYLRRPWLVRVPMSGPPAGPHHIAWMESALAVLRGTGLDWARKIAVLGLISGYARQAVLQSQDLAAGRGEGTGQASAERDYGRALTRLVDPGRFPESARLFASSLFEAPPVTTDEAMADSDFAVGLELILDGVAAAVSRATDGAATT